MFCNIWQHSRKIDEYAWFLIVENGRKTTTPKVYNLQVTNILKSEHDFVTCMTQVQVKRNKCIVMALDQ